MQYNFLQIEFLDGHILYLNNFITLIAIVILLFYVCWSVNAKKFDKALHSSISAIITVIGLTLCYFLHFPWWLAPIVVLAIGLLKECYDKIFKTTHLFDPEDLKADIIGVGTITVAFIFSVLLCTPM